MPNIHALDHRGIDGHPQVFEIALPGREGVPVGEILRIGRERGIGGNEAHFLLPTEPRFAHRLPAARVFAAIPCDVGLVCLQRIVRRLVTQIEEEGLGRFGWRSGVQELNRTVGEFIAAVVVRPELGEGLAVVPLTRRTFEVIGEAGEKAEEPIEAAIHRMPREMPLADKRSAIAGVVELLRNQRRFAELRQRARPPFSREQ